MCGIFSVVGDPALVRRLDLPNAIRAMRHRGPDGCGSFHDEQTSRSIACCFAHTRLAIVDLSTAGNQPMSTEDGRFTICYNGEIYNYVELRTHLKGLGEVFQSGCDTEVVLKGYRRWGSEIVHRLRGMFAFCIWDRARAALFFARDRLGIKPLYYVHRGGSLAVASEVRVLLETGRAARSFSMEGLRSYFQFGAVSDPCTIVEGIHSLMPGHRAHFSEGSLRIEPYWTLASNGGVQSEETVASIRTKLKDAVLGELEADVPVGIFLSGGIDSAALVSVAASNASRPLKTFTVTFDERSYSEAEYAAQVAARFGCDHRQVHVTASRAPAEIERVLSALDQPSSDGANTFIVARAAREAGLSVALSGVGGDEIFAGYPHFRTFARLLRFRGLMTTASRFVRDRKIQGDAFVRRPSWVGKAVDLVAASGEPAPTYAALRAMFTKAERHSLLAPEIALPSGDWDRLYGCALSDPIGLFSRFELSQYLRNTLLRDTDAMSMAHSLEVRVPYLDHTLVEAALAVPGHRKLSRKTNKPLLVEAATALPEEVVNRPKMGFVLPLDSWFRVDLKPLISELLLGAPMRRLTFMNSSSVAALWRGFLRDEKLVSYSRVWCLAALSGWAETNRVSL